MLNILWFMNTNSDLQGLSAVVPGSIDNYFSNMYYKILMLSMLCVSMCMFMVDPNKFFFHVSMS